MLDANGEPERRWLRIKQLFETTFPNLPAVLPKGGLIVENHEGLRFGVWLMPDCLGSGMLETFLARLIPDHESDPLWEHAKAAFEQAQDKGCCCRDTHADKARIHTWLAWQDPPGERFGIALIKRILDPASSSAAFFIAWFRQLYKL